MNARSSEVARIPANAWAVAVRHYLSVVLVANLLWEVFHLPLCTVWREGTLQYPAFVVLHCAGGDLLIALAALMLAIVLTAPGRWPIEGFARIALLTTLFGVAYTVFSEWLNIVVRKSWQYSESMPVVPVIDTGLSPLMQWLIVPPFSLWLTRRAVMARCRSLEIPS